MDMKTSKDLVPSLRGSAFRRVVFDGRCSFLRAIRTGAQMGLQRKPPVAAAASARRLKQKPPVGAAAASARRGTA